MTPDDKRKFWEALCSFTGENPKEEGQRLQKLLVHPRFLFRYRKADLNSLEALRCNTLYFSTADYYDDPFDTFMATDIKRLMHNFFSCYQSDESKSRLAGLFSQVLADPSKTNLPQDIQKELQKHANSQDLSSVFSNVFFELWVFYFLQIREQLQKEIYSICFSETGLNETLWLKYADCHRGFALVYDLTNTDLSFSCAKSRELGDLPVKPTVFYPVYYSDTPYDATDFALSFFMKTLSQGLNIDLFSACSKEALERLNKFAWEQERTSLIKKKCHENDEEWRMLLPGIGVSTPKLHWQPFGVILGLRMSPVQCNLVVSMAKQAGIKNFYQVRINTKNQLDAIKIEY